MGLRQSIDEGARDIGIEMADDLPESAEELKSEVPEDTAALSEDGIPADADGFSLERVVAETPLDGYL